MLKNNSLFNDWKSRKRAQQKVHQKLMERLKKQKTKPLNDIAEQLHVEVFKKIDCLDCANCCSTIPPRLTKTDASRIAKHLSLKVSEFEAQFLHQDADGDWVMNTTPCPFLDTLSNKCNIYDVRPRACQQYPHTNHFQFVDNMNLQAVNGQHCPAVFHILEKMMQTF